MKHLNTFEGYNNYLKETFKKGDMVKLTIGLDKDPDDGEFAYSVEDGEIGRITRVVREETDVELPIYSVKFEPQNGVNRMPQLSHACLEKI